jgi:hypothetical protein
MMLGFPEWVVYAWPWCRRCILTTIIAPVPGRDGRRVLRGRKPRMSAISLSLTIFAIMLVADGAACADCHRDVRRGHCRLHHAGRVGSRTGSFLNTQAFARFASYDLSVIPLFILMGHFATQGGISRALFQFAAAVMGGFRGGLAMAAVLACAAFGAICGSSVATAATITSCGPARDEAPRLFGPALDRHAGGRRHAGHPDPAVRAAGDLRHPGRAEHRQAVRRSHGARRDCDGGLHDRDRDLCARGARPGARGRGWRPPGDHDGIAGWHACPSPDLHSGVRRHLRRPVHPHRRRSRRRGLDLRGGAVQARDHAGQKFKVNVFMPRPRARR